LNVAPEIRQRRAVAASAEVGRRPARAAQPILVAADVFPYEIALEDERARHHVVEKRPIVRHEQQCPRPLDELRLEQFERLEIEIVGRFVEHQ